MVFIPLILNRLITILDVYYRLHGILLRFDDIKFVEDTGRIIDDNPLMYWKIEANFSVLKIEQNQLVKAQVKTLGTNFIRSSIANCLNINIEFSPDLKPEELSFCTSFKLNDEVIFRVKSLAFTEMTVSGIIDEVCMEQMRLLYGF